MSPQQFKAIREKFEFTQAAFAECLGLTQKTVSQYEIGFRKPGPTVVVVLKTLNRLPMKQSTQILELMRSFSVAGKKKPNRASG